MGLFRNSYQYLYSSKIMRLLGAISVLFVILFLGQSCNGWEKEADKAAEKYYTFLIKEKYEDFVAGIAYSDSMPQFYKEEMLEVARSFVCREKEKHGGLISVEAKNSVEKGNIANAFIEITFADSVKENVSVPMVKCGEIWKMQ